MMDGALLTTETGGFTRSRVAPAGCSTLRAFLGLRGAFFKQPRGRRRLPGAVMIRSGRGRSGRGRGVVQSQIVVLVKGIGWQRRDCRGRLLVGDPFPINFCCKSRRLNLVEFLVAHDQTLDKKR